MRAFLLVFVATATMVASNLDLVSAVADESTTSSIDNAKIKETSKRFLKSYNMSELDEKKDKTKQEERVINLANIDDVIDVTKLDDLINPDKIKAALGNADEEAALFATWHENPAMSKAIFQRLSTNGNFLKNKDVVLKYSAYMTRLKNNKQLTPFLDTKAVDEAIDTLKTNGMRAVAENFKVWLKDGLTKQEFATAVEAHPELTKKYTAIVFQFGSFADYQIILAKRAAAAAAKKAAEVSS